MENYYRKPLPIYLFCIITFIFIEINHFLLLFVSISYSFSRQLHNNLGVKFFLIFFHFFSVRNINFNLMSKRSLGGIKKY